MWQTSVSSPGIVHSTLIAVFPLRRMKSNTMSNLNRGIMKFDNADKPIIVTISAALVFGGIAFLIWWAFQFAYAMD
ncbi:MAG: hypothetical protein BRC36_14185 [Cyanobacteria bacterium QH_2_48_84]|nr:MAG: hypothetical protein BRC36_14185 [Cyanobacteria bacterium QH_2_48_84]